MPHKHTRRGVDPSEYDLPPNKLARPLPALSSKDRREAADAKKKKAKAAAANEPQHARTDKKRTADFGDDAPRAFKRIMRIANKKQAGTILKTAPQKPQKQPSKAAVARKKAMEAAAEKQKKEAEENKIEVPKIQPGERLSDFAARVDQSIPVVGLTNKMQKNGKDVMGMKVYRTRKEKKMHKLYDQWRAEERKIQAQRDDDAEAAAERELENGNRLMDNGIMDGFRYDSLRPTGRADVEEGASKKKKKQKRGAGKKKAEDPWAVLLKKRGETKVKLHDVVQAPPELHMKMDAKLKMRGNPKEEFV
ncbi:hypothetical protein TD95_002870 [Thielaviopsis punctulata]|uniref:Uncharacterized protein n=1 Tax=Thielaviopsis punctulata TaxID=72032 RepID=A0A0F4ZFB1_9PEZI|nr:hypothetical protein TD95_002870 [Thielaviopsis punctulata]